MLALLINKAGPTEQTLVHCHSQHVKQGLTLHQACEHQAAACAQAAAEREWWQGTGPREHWQDSVPPLAEGCWPTLI